MAMLDQAPVYKSCGQFLLAGFAFTNLELCLKGRTAILMHADPGFLR